MTRNSLLGTTKARLTGAALVASAAIVLPALAVEAATPAATPAATTPNTPTSHTTPAAGTCATAAGSWPMYQGDPTHSANACSSLTPANVPALRPAWFVSTAGAVTDTPVVTGGTVYAGDYAGVVHALDEATGATKWTFDAVGSQTCFLDLADPHADTHQSGFGEIPASPAVSTIAGRPTLFIAAGGSLFALDAATGSCLWAEDTDPADPTSAAEIESSPVVDTAVNPPEVIVGNDDNSSSGVAVTGVMGFNAQTGALLWKYEPERDLTLIPREFGGSDSLTLSCGDGAADPAYCTSTNVPDLPPNSLTYADGCGDVWSSPAVDPSFADPAGDNTFEGSGSAAPTGWHPKQITSSGAANNPGAPDGLVVFGTGNCAATPTPATALAHDDYVDNQGVFALDPVTGVRVWDFVEPYNIYDNNPNEPGGGDDDFGSSPMVAALPAGSVNPAACAPTETTETTGTTTLVIEGSKSGTAYGLCGQTGRVVWSVQAAQPGEASADLVGAVGGFLGSPSLGLTNGRPTAFFTSAIPTPFANDGFREPDNGDTNISSCPGLAGVPLLPACPDLTLPGNPARLVSLHAIDAATGAIDWQGPSLPSYAASTYTNGVVFFPDSLATAVTAFNADNGTPLWAFPLAGVPASGAAIDGNAIFLGSGEAEESEDGETVPPQATGIWSFSTTATVPTITPPSLP